MGYKPPKAIARAGIETGATKARLSWDKALVAGFLAGAYIAFAGLLAFTVTAGMPERNWGTLPSFFAGAVFSLGLILVIAAGAYGFLYAQREPEEPGDTPSGAPERDPDGVAVGTR